ncbi:MAG: DUF4031 domain-containing protein [Antricoccus sp.]
MYIDRPVWPGHGRVWAHLISDESFDELHVFAQTIGIPRRAFDGDHYDVVAEMWEQAVASGARPTVSKEIVRRLRTSDLRRPKHLR